MAKKPTQPANEAIQTKNLPTASRKAVHKIVGDMGKDVKGVIGTSVKSLKTQSANAAARSAAAATPEDAAKEAKKSAGYDARVRRLETIGTVVKPRKLTVQQAADNIESLVRLGATDLAPARDENGTIQRMWKIDEATGGVDKGPGIKGKPILAGTRMPGETLAGMGFYHAGHEEARSISPDNPEAAFSATAAASSRSRVEDEEAAAAAVFRAHRSGATVYMHPAIYQHLANTGSAPSAALINQTVKVADLPTETVAHMADSEISPLMRVHSKGVDFTQIGKASNLENRLKVIRIARGETPSDEGQNPFSAPKTWSYARNKAEATPETRDEYNMRGAHFADVLTGRVGGGQQMFDYHGLRNSNEGILSNEGHTTEDSWMKSVDMRHMVPAEYPDKKALGELGPSTKQAVIGGKTVKVHPHPDAAGPAVMHAFGNEATTTAAKQMQSKLGVDYAVPAAMIQEVAWASARRTDYKESVPEYRDQLAGLQHSAAAEDRAKVRAAKAAAKPAKGKYGLPPKQDGMLF